MRLNKRPKAMLALVMALSLILTYMPISVYAAEVEIGKSTAENKLLFGIGDNVVFNMMVNNPDASHTDTFTSIIDYFFNNAENVSIYRTDSNYIDGEQLILNTDYTLAGVDKNEIVLRTPENPLILESGESSYRNLHYTIQESDYCKDLSNALDVKGINSAGNRLLAWTEKRIHVVGVRINITPAEDTNRVGDTHEFVAKVEVNWAGAAGHGKSGNVGVWENAPDGTKVNFYIADGPGYFDEDYDTTDDGIVAVAGGNGEARIHLVSTEVGTTEVGASTEYTFDATTEDAAAPLYTTQASTNGLLGSGNNVLKHWVDASITIEPDGTNPVNNTHTFASTVRIIDENGERAVPDGTLVTFVIENGGPGTFIEDYGTPNDGIVGTVNGVAQIGLNSAVVGKTEVSATANITDPVNMTVKTDGAGKNSDNAIKNWVDAYITITPDGTNPVNNKHTFTSTVMVYNGSGYVAVPDGTEVTFAIESGPGSFVDDTYGTSNDGVVAVSGGIATIGLISDVTGVTEVSATANITNPANMTVTTDGTGQNSDNAKKTWVDAYIMITPDGTNIINDKHIFTSTVMVYNGSGYVAVPDGTEVNFAIVNGPGSFVDDNYGTANDGIVAISGGAATIGLTSDVIGVTEVSATADITDPVNLTVTTDGTGQNSGNAFKTWIKPDIQLVKTVDFDGDTVFTDLETNVPGATADYKYEVTLGADSVPLTNIQLVDDILGPIAGPAEGDGNIIGTLEVGETWIYYSYDNVIMQDTVNWGTVTGEDELGNEVSATDDAAVTVEAIFEGKTPGYWKNHAEMWVDYTPGQILEDVFDVPDSLGLDNKTLMEALSFSGGKGDLGAAQNLFRAAAAAILNASHPNLNYEFELDYIITSVNEALTQGRAAMLELAAELDRANNAEGDIDN
ncbi:MAG: hypothetical protein ACM3ZR_10510 [Pseudomonadota bacterium]